MTTTRSRTRLLIALACVIAAGLATRSSAIPWPDFVTAHFGDALWCVAVYLSLAWVAPTQTPLHLAAAATLISFGVEISQLADWPWLNSIRETLPGKLLLGIGFQWLDFPRYLAGALSCFALDAGFPALLAARTDHHQPNGEH